VPPRIAVPNSFAPSMAGGKQQQKLLFTSTEAATHPAAAGGKRNHTITDLVTDQEEAVLPPAQKKPRLRLGGPKASTSLASSKVPKGDAVIDVDADNAKELTSESGGDSKIKAVVARKRKTWTKLREKQSKSSADSPKAPIARNETSSDESDESDQTKLGPFTTSLLATLLYLHLPFSDRAVLKWTAPVYHCFAPPLIRTVTDKGKTRTYQYFRCLKSQCTHGNQGGVRRYLDTRDYSSTKPLTQHIIRCQPGLLEGIADGSQQPPPRDSRDANIVTMMKIKCPPKKYSQKPLTKEEIKCDSPSFKYQDVH